MSKSFEEYVEKRAREAARIAAEKAARESSKNIAVELWNEIVNIPLHIFLKNLNDVVYWNKFPWSVAEWGFIPKQRRVYATCDNAV